jgi:tetratricopeptide (TPR) repeat protein
MFIVQTFASRSAGTDIARLAVQWEAEHQAQTQAHACVSVDFNADPELKATFLEAIGQACLEYGSIEQAIASLQEALELKRRVFGADHPLVAESRRELASALRNASRFDEALEQIEDALPTIERVFGKKNVVFGDALLERAAINLAANNLSEAQSDALESFEILSSHGDIRRVHCLDLQARVINVCAGGDKGKLLEALKLYKQILAEPLLTDKHPWRGTFIHNEGTILHEVGEFAAAKRNFDVVIELWRKTSSDARPSLIDAHINRGRTLRELGDRPSARADVQAALDLDRQVRGARHPYVAYDLVCLARLLMEEGGEQNALQAGQALDEAIAIYRERGFQQHAYLEVALRRRFQLLENQKDLVEADAIQAALDASCGGSETKCA